MPNRKANTSKNRSTKKEYKYKGRPTKMTARTVQKIEESLKAGGTVEQACSYAGISRSTFYEWLKKNDDFSDTIESATNYMIMLCYITLNKAIKKGDWRAAVAYLDKKDDTRKSEKYRDDDGDHLDESELIDG